MINIPVDPIEHVEPLPHSTPKRGEVAAVATLVGNIKKLSTEDLKSFIHHSS